jgi:hypothetical protein
MTLWIVHRGSEYLGGFIAERLELRAGSLFAMRGNRIVGSVASGPGLTWQARELL